MCGRYHIISTEAQLEKRFNARFANGGIDVRYNIAPTLNNPVIINERPEDIVKYRWGLIPFWAKDISVGVRMINARSESLTEKPAFKESFERRRCLVLSDGFYEWKKDGSNKTPYRVCLKSEQPHAMAGLWERWLDAEKREIRSYTIITVPANKTIEAIHDRMPAILLPEHEKEWLSDSISSSALLDLLYPYPDDLIRAYTVSKLVSSVKNNVPEVLEPTVYDTPKQGDLFS